MDDPSLENMRPQLPLARWTQLFEGKSLQNFQERADYLFGKAFGDYKPKSRGGEGCHAPMMGCLLEECGPWPGYPMSSKEEATRHYKEAHEDEYCEELQHTISRLFEHERRKRRLCLSDEEQISGLHKKTQ
jgi:hypothetical protein